MTPAKLSLLQRHVEELRGCRRCPAMIPPVVSGPPVVSEVYLIGQAPGVHEPQLGRPFAWTAGKTLFRWFASIGVEEQAFRERVYMAAVCRCFPGKTAQGGDRVPAPNEIENCSEWMRREIQLLEPKLVIPVGRLAISQILPANKLENLIGNQYHAQVFGHRCDVIPLPHPSGASTWFRREPGQSLTQSALALIGGHPAFRTIL